MYNLIEIGKRLREKRIEKEYKSQKSFANDLNINPSTISAYEKGDKLMTLEHLTIICAKLECSLDWMMFGKTDTPITLTVETKTPGEKVADAFITLIDADILSNENKIKTGKVNIHGIQETHNNYMIFMNDYNHIRAKIFYDAYLASVKNFHITDTESRKNIAESLTKSYKKSLDEECKRTGFFK